MDFAISITSPIYRSSNCEDGKNLETCFFNPGFTKPLCRKIGFDCTLFQWRRPGRADGGTTAIMMIPSVDLPGQGTSLQNASHKNIQLAQKSTNMSEMVLGPYQWFKGFHQEIKSLQNVLLCCHGNKIRWMWVKWPTCKTKAFMINLQDTSN